MGNILRITISAGAIALFLLIGWATSIDKDFGDFDLGVFPMLVNTSDSCNVASPSFIFKKRRDSYDTLTVNVFLPPGDSVTIGLDSVVYDSLFFFCSCPDSMVHTVKMSLNSRFETDQKIELNCN